MKGTVIERPAGSKQYSIRYSAGKDPVTGKYRQIWESGFSSSKEAKKRLNELEYERNRGTLPRSDRLTLGIFLGKWLDDNRSNLSPKTAQGYESIIRQHLAGDLGAIPLSKLTHEDVQHYYTSKLTHGRCDGRGALSPTTVSHHHTMLHRALQSAVRSHLIPFNPADVEDKPKPRVPEIQTMDRGDLHLFLEAAKKTDYYCLFFTHLWTGARRGELLALRWADVDLIQAQIHIARAVIQLNDGSLVYKTPKSKRGRMVALSPDNAMLLRRHKEQREAQCAPLGIEFEPESLVFCRPDGSNIMPNSASKAWAYLVKKTGLKHVTLHGARHTHATMLLEQNVHPLVVSQRLGHSKISTTLDIYSHVKPELQRAAAAQLDGMLKEHPAEANL